jgi:hypothetical protein
MLNLLGFEFKKFVLKPHILLLLILCTAVNMVGTYASCRRIRLDEFSEAFTTLYDGFLQGELTEEKINFVITETERLQALTADRTASHEMGTGTYTDFNVFGDFNFFYFLLYPEMEYAVSYSFTANEIVEKASDNITFFEEKGNHYEVRVNEKIAARYANRVIHEFYDLRAMDNYLIYDFSNLVALLVCLVVIVPVFVSEKEAEMDKLLPALKNGAGKLVQVKVFFTFLVVLLVSLWFSLWDFIGFSLFSPLQNFDAPLYAIEIFQFTPLDITISQYFLLNFIFKTIGLGAITSLVLLASQAFRKTLYAFAVSTVAVLIPYLSRLSEKRSFTFLELINPALMLENRQLFKLFSVQNILGYPIASYWVALIATILLSSAALALVILFSNPVHPFKFNKKQ